MRYHVLFKSSNRQKKCVDCTVRTDANVAGPYTDMAELSWRTGGSCVDESFLDTWHYGEWIGDTWPKQGPPRVTLAMV